MKKKLKQCLLGETSVIVSKCAILYDSDTLLKG